MLTVNKKSLHYWVYKATYSMFGSNTPNDTNLCQYFRRLMLSPLFFLTFAMIVPVVTATILIAMTLLTILRLPFGYYPNGIGLEEFAQYPGLKIGTSFELYPYHIGIVAAFVALNYWCFKTGYATAAIILDGIVIVPFVIIAMYLIFKKTEFSDLISNYWKAKKEKICPLIEFEGGE